MLSFSAMMFQDLYAVIIFLLLGHATYVWKYFDDLVIWSVVLEYKICDCSNGLSEPFKPCERGKIPDQHTCTCGFFQVLKLAY